MNDPICLTNKDVLDFCERQKGVEDSLNVIQKAIERIEKFQDDRMSEIDRRLDTLEKWRAWLTGAMVVVAAVLGIIGKSVWDMYIDYPSTIQEAVKNEISDKYDINIEP